MANIGELQNIPISTSGTDTAIVAGVANRSIKVLGYCISASQNNIVRLEDGQGGPILAEQNMGNNNFCSAPVTEKGWFRTSPGNSLNINVSGGGVRGHILFEEE